MSYGFRAIVRGLWNGRSYHPGVFFILMLVALVLSACVAPRPALTDRSQALRLVDESPPLSDDLSLESLAEGVRQNIQQLSKLDSTESMRFGSDVVVRSAYIDALQALLAVLESGASQVDVLGFIAARFNFYEVYGQEEWGQVLVTGYYDPVIPGSQQATDEFSRPLYGLPADLVEIQFGEFISVMPDLRPGALAHEREGTNLLRGRLVPREGRIPAVVPFYSREQIDGGGALAGRSLELCWVKPIDAFFLQIQGSGIVDLGNGERLRVGYAGQNGQPYTAIGKFLTDVIPLEQMSMQRIHAHLETLDPAQQQAVLNRNPSYVFFRTLDGKSRTSLNTEVTAGRTLATDSRFFPKGALAFLDIEVPSFDSANPQPEAPTAWQRAPRFVLDQDTGGAIRGGYRADLYWGEGDEAARSAGVMKRWGRLYYLAPKPEFLAALSKAAAGVPR